MRRAGHVLLAVITSASVLVVSGLAPASARPAATCGKWTIVPSANLGVPPGSNNNELRAVAARNGTDAWAVGYAYRFGLNKAMVEHWNGTSWTAKTAPSVSGAQNQLDGVVALGAKNAWAVGDATNSGGVQAIIEHYNGHSWKMVPTNAPGGKNHLTGIVALGTKNIWAVGYSDQGGGIVNTLILHWNGTSWSSATSPDPFDENFLQAVGRIPGTSDLWAVGNGYSGGWHTLILQFHSGTWSQVASDDTGVTFPSLLGVAATSNSNAWAVGNDTGPIGEQWNGSSWSMQTTLAPSSGKYEFHGATAVGSTIWIAGARRDTNNNDHPQMFKWTSSHGFSAVTSQTPPKSESAGLVAVARIPGTKHLWAVGSWYTNTSNYMTLIESYC